MADLLRGTVETKETTTADPGDRLIEQEAKAQENLPPPLDTDTEEENDELRAPLVRVDMAKEDPFRGVEKMMEIDEVRQNPKPASDPIKRERSSTSLFFELNEIIGDHPLHNIVGCEATNKAGQIIARGETIYHFLKEQLHPALDTDAINGITDIVLKVYKDNSYHIFNVNLFKIMAHRQAFEQEVLDYQERYSDRGDKWWERDQYNAGYIDKVREILKGYNLDELRETVDKNFFEAIKAWCDQSQDFCGLLIKPCKEQYRKGDMTLFLLLPRAEQEEIMGQEKQALRRKAEALEKESQKYAWPDPSKSNEDELFGDLGDLAARLKKKDKKRQQSPPRESGFPSPTGKRIEHPYFADGGTSLDDDLQALTDDFIGAPSSDQPSKVKPAKSKKKAMTDDEISADLSSLLGEFGISSNMAEIEDLRTKQDKARTAREHQRRMKEDKEYYLEQRYTIHASEFVGDQNEVKAWREYLKAAVDRHIIDKKEEIARFQSEYKAISAQLIQINAVVDAIIKKGVFIPVASLLRTITLSSSVVEKYKTTSDALQESGVDLEDRSAADLRTIADKFAKQQALLALHSSHKNWIQDPTDIPMDTCRCVTRLLQYYKDDFKKADEDLSDEDAEDKALHVLEEQGWARIHRGYENHLTGDEYVAPTWFYNTDRHNKQVSLLLSRQEKPPNLSSVCRSLCSSGLRLYNEIMKKVKNMESFATDDPKLIGQEIPIEMLPEDMRKERIRKYGHQTSMSNTGKSKEAMLREFYNKLEGNSAGTSSAGIGLNEGIDAKLKEMSAKGKSYEGPVFRKGMTYGEAMGQDKMNEYKGKAASRHTLEVREQHQRGLESMSAMMMGGMSEEAQDMRQSAYRKKTPEEMRHNMAKAGAAYTMAGGVATPSMMAIKPAIENMTRDQANNAANEAMEESKSRWQGSKGKAVKGRSGYGGSFVGGPRSIRDKTDLDSMRSSRSYARRSNRAIKGNESDSD